MESIELAKEMLKFLIVMKDKEMVNSVQKRDIVQKYTLVRYTDSQIDEALQVLLRNGNIGILDGEDIFLINRSEIIEKEWDGTSEVGKLITKISEYYGFKENEIFINEIDEDYIEFSVCRVLYRLHASCDWMVRDLRIICQAKC